MLIRGIGAEEKQMAVEAKPAPSQEPNVTIQMVLSGGKISELARVYIDPKLLALKIQDAKNRLNDAVNNKMGSANPATQAMFDLMKTGDKIQFIYDGKVYDEWVYPFRFGMNAPTAAVIGVFAAIGITAAVLSKRK